MATSSITKKTSTPPSKGLMFQASIKGKPNVLGVIARDDINVGPMTDAFLVYLFKPEITALSPEIDDVSNFSTQPIITDISPWKKGIFKVIGKAPSLPNIESFAPTFQHPLNGRFFTIQGNLTDDQSTPNGEWSVWTDTGIKDLLDEAL
jgi:hypothetical protein